MIVGGLGAFLVFFVQASNPERRPGSYTELRQNLGRSILLGLEVLIIADIVRTIVIDQTFESVTVLGVIVVIRILLASRSRSRWTARARGTAGEGGALRRRAAAELTRASPKVASCPRFATFSGPSFPTRARDSLKSGAAWARWSSRSSKPVRSCHPRLGRFDSGAAPSSRLRRRHGAGGGGRWQERRRVKNRSRPLETAWEGR